MPKVNDSQSEPYGRTISTMIPSLILEKAEVDPEWNTYRNGWLPILSVPFASYYEDSIDLSGYALQGMTFFPELGFLQESPLRSITGSEAGGMIDTTIVSSVPLNVDSVIRELIFSSAPGLIPLGNVGITDPSDWSQILYCRIRHDTLDPAFASSTGFTRPVDIGQVGSLEPTAADKLFITRIVQPYGTVTNTELYGTLGAPAQRVGFRGSMAEEPEIEYMMRLKRSYELANQV
jgi:hypothetical protein